MLRPTLILFVLLILISCGEDDAAPECSVPAIVRDLRGLDGCGFVFELEDGTRIEPMIYYYTELCDLSPKSNNPFRHEPDDPLSSFEFVDGKRVRIDYEIQDAGSYCMVGPTARITCITELGFDEQEITP